MADANPNRSGNKPPDVAAPRAANDGAPPLGLRERAPQTVPPEKDRADALGLIAGIVIVAGIGALVLRSMDRPPPVDRPAPEQTAQLVAAPDAPTYAPQGAAGAAEATDLPAPDLVELVPLELPEGYDLSAPDRSPVYSLDPGNSEMPAARPSGEAPEAPALIYDGGREAPGRSTVMIEPERAAEPAASSLRANPGQRQATLARGTLLPSILESPVDTRNPGAVRAVVSTDVRSFDGKRALVPRSSRLVGQYYPAVVNGEPRAYVVWTRLVTPDGRMTRLADPPASSERAFMAAFRNAPLLSVLGSGAQSDGGAIRVRTGEPIRVFLARNFDMAASGR